MPPSSFNQLDNRGADWDTMLQARAMVEGQTTESTGGGTAIGPALLIVGAALLAVILVAMAIGAG
jgi:hypothetical protein